jgi:hypothetical protein
MRRVLATLVIIAAGGGCSASQAQIARNLGIGITAEGAAVGLVTQATRAPGDGRFDALITAAPLLVPGAAMWIIGCLRSRSLTP